ncbi:hypothetical protein Cs7R123_03310 [Catellatospora sp. TT07R-123]|uniref:hypothetical protein n=1 Tax=Catellatospora sp. TT07R-123 TaxID=2733863 RepID=UPI001AFCE537|nr:hypothetical protein [Catellatospora sp. TT07R-123]GHJ42989.1 hypothetical protein Cs7R123_03310 [Catellatospora sp. TT07R-123]
MWFVEEYLDDNDHLAAVGLPLEEPGVLTAPEAEFVGELRRLAASWTVPVTGSFVTRHDDENDIADALAVVVQIEGCAWGASLVDGTTLTCGELHNQLYYPLPGDSAAFTVAGQPADLARDAAQWLEALLRRPVVRLQWLHRGQVYRERCMFADTGRLQWTMYNNTLAPMRSLLRRFRDPDKPDRVVPVRN